MPKTPSLSEFELIRRYFAALTPSRDDVLLGIGDDAALLKVPPGMELAVSIDTLVAGTHFLPDVSPLRLGCKSLAVNLSDLAAMGAEPAWATLALTLPAVDSGWLQDFAEGFAELAGRYGVQLVGGDTTRGPLSLTLQLHGFVPEGQALRRRGGHPGDRIYVTGRLGDAALALLLLRRQGALRVPPPLLRRLEMPQPRVEAGLALRGVASSAIDISDGLLADLGHLLEAGGGGARIELERLPLSGETAEFIAKEGDWSPALVGGDDYELCFTLPPERSGEVDEIARRLRLAMTPIGEITREPGLHVMLPDGRPWQGRVRGYDHFAPLRGEN